MKCPQCGTEFEGQVEQCFTCGWDFAENPAEFKPKTSKLAVLTLILGVLCPFTLCLLFIPVLVVGAIAQSKIRRSEGRLTGRGLVNAGICVAILFLVCLFIIWCLDAGPVTNEFTEADFMVVRSENEITYSILCQLNDENNDPNGAPAIGLNKEDVTLLENLWEQLSEQETIQFRFESVRKHAEEINHLWGQSSKGRLIIKELSTYNQIADLTEAHIDAVLPYGRDIKLLLKINLLHSLLLLEKGDDIQACQELVAFDAIFRKHSVFARSLISKLICYGVFEKDFEAATMMVSHSSISNEALLLLQSHFNSLAEEQMSLKNSFIHEYLMFKNSMADLFKAAKRHKMPMYKQNSICRYYDGICRNWILMERRQTPYEYCPISVWPWEKPVWPKVSLNIDQIIEQYYDLYFFYNPLGSGIMKIMLPALEKIIDIKNKILIEEDFFQWVLARRLGQEGSLKARAYSDEYTVDIEKELVFSVGPDGVPYTKDDIKMQINPDVLGLK
jgi:hypothetical protein